MSSSTVAPRGAGPSQLIAREIRAELGRQQLSNRRFAMLIRVSPMWVNRRLSLCDVPLTLEDVQRIADGLGVSTERFGVRLPRLDGPDGGGASGLPRLDSNQQPADYSARLAVAA